MLNLRTMYRLRRLIKVMLPVLATQLAIIGMNFFDATMSGHAGAEQLAWFIYRWKPYDAYYCKFYRYFNGCYAYNRPFDW